MDTEKNVSGLKCIVMTETVCIEIATERHFLDELINERFNRIVQRCEANQYVALGTNQQMAITSNSQGMFMVVLITASVASREEVERAQRQAQLGGVGFSPNGPRRMQ